MFDRILVAVDGSENSKRALSYAVELARKFDATITLVHVYSGILPIIPAADALSSSTGTPPVPTSVAVRIIEEAEKLGNKILEDAEKAVKEQGIPVDKILKEGDVVKEIVAEAQRGGFNLIVVGHRGMSKLGELLLGAVSEGVSHRAPCPVLIVK